MYDTGSEDISVNVNTRKLLRRRKYTIPLLDDVRLSTFLLTHDAQSNSDVADIQVELQRSSDLAIDYDENMSITKLCMKNISTTQQNIYQCE